MTIGGLLRRSPSPVRKLVPNQDPLPQIEILDRENPLASAMTAVVDPNELAKNVATNLAAIRPAAIRPAAIRLAANLARPKPAPVKVGPVKVDLVVRQKHVPASREPMIRESPGPRTRAQRVQASPVVVIARSVRALPMG